jgi:uncharacterized metal-binding protein
MEKCIALLVLVGILVVLWNQQRRQKRLLQLMVACSRKTLEYAGFSVDKHVVVTELGIKKESGFAIDTEQIKKVVRKIKR